MSDKTYKYFVVISEHYSLEDPFALLRRVVMPDGGSGRDEAMSYARDWEYTTLLRSHERGDTQFQFVEVDEAEAEQVRERMLAKRAAREAQQ